MPEPITGPPDFVGIGTQQAGGEWWLRMLSQHPSIETVTGQRTALKFFGPYCMREMKDADIARYHALFRRDPGMVIGEWSVRYLFDVWTLPLILRAAPGAKLLVLLRDPIERYRSALARRRSDKTRRRRRGMYYTTEAVQRSRYAAQLQILYSFFPPEQVLVIQFEQLLAEPVAQYARTLRFLGVDDTFVPWKFRLLCRDGRPPRDPERLLRPYGQPRWMSFRAFRGSSVQPTGHDVHLWPDIRETVIEDLRDDVLQLPDLLPDFDLSLWPAFAELR